MISAVVVAIFHDVLCGSSRRIRLQTSHDQDAGFEFPFADRTNLIVEAFDVHVPKGYIYFAMGFLVFVELLNLAFAEKIVASRLTRSLRTRQRKTKLSYRMRL